MPSGQPTPPSRAEQELLIPSLGTSKRTGEKGVELHLRTFRADIRERVVDPWNRLPTALTLS